MAPSSPPRINPVRGVAAALRVLTSFCLVVSALGQTPSGTPSSTPSTSISAGSSTPAAHNQCRCFPGDSCWPSTQSWASFNQSINGALITTIPLASPCHDPNLNVAACQSLQANWDVPDTHVASSSSIMSPLFANRSCDPFQPADTPCLLGNYISYAVNVSTTDQVSKTIQFAHENNIRLVIRNTGHDYNGKSTGAGAIGLWMHYLDSIDIVDYSSSFYSGKAIKVGAGVELSGVNAVVNANGLVVVGGQCESVGLAGGYTQGGGHSTLSSRFGMAADQVLEWEVVDGTGRLLTATPQENSDLYWALSGGGGSSYGVVWSMTARAYPDNYTTGANLFINRTNAISDNAFYEAVEYYQASLPAIVDAGGWSTAFISSTTFYVTFIGFGLHSAEVTALLSPVEGNITRLNIPYTINIKEFPSWNETINTFESAVQVNNAQYGSWLIPRSVVTNQNTGLINAYRDIVGAGADVVGIALAPRQQTQIDNAVLPAWRQTLIHVIITLPWNDTAPWADEVAQQRELTNTLVPELTRLAPNSGAYLNEAAPYQPNWQQAFYGTNYQRLLGVKAKYDPLGVFYALQAVGSEAWTQLNDGRLCKA